MKLLSLLLCGCAMGVSLSASLSAAVQPHPTRAGRLVDERDGFRVEFSPGQEAYVEAMFVALKEYAAKEAQLALGPDAPQPGSWVDLQAHRDEILRQVAAEIGLPAPTEHQGRVFDAMLDVYEFSARQDELTKAAEARASRPERIELWGWDDLTHRLMAGATIEGYRYDPGTRKLHHTLVIPPALLVAGDFQADGVSLVQSERGLRFTYRDKDDGVVYLKFWADRKDDDQWTSTAVGFVPKIPRPAPLKPAAWSDRWARAAVEGNRRFCEEYHGTVSVCLDEKTPAEAVEEVVGPAWSKAAEIRARPPEVNSTMVHVILHEVVDGGIVENFIGGADRRWLCEGVAEYVAWKILRDRFGAAFARRGYDLEARLAECVALQPKIDLRRWAVPERASKVERNKPLRLAYYAFAMRTVSEMARRDGEAVVPKLFQEIAKTPRAKVRMETVEKAYRKLTGKKLGEVLKYAETAPVPVAAK